MHEYAAGIHPCAARLSPACPYIFRIILIKLLRERLDHGTGMDRIGWHPHAIHCYDSATIYAGLYLWLGRTGLIRRTPPPPWWFHFVILLLCFWSSCSAIASYVKNMDALATAYSTTERIRPIRNLVSRESVHPGDNRGDVALHPPFLVALSGLGCDQTQSRQN